MAIGKIIIELPIQERHELNQYLYERNQPELHKIIKYHCVSTDYRYETFDDKLERVYYSNLNGYNITMRNDLNDGEYEWLKDHGYLTIKMSQ